MSRPATTVDGDLVAALRGAGLSDVDGSGLARALYSSDASLYRVLPRAVVRPGSWRTCLSMVAVNHRESRALVAILRSCQRAGASR